MSAVPQPFADPRQAAANPWGQRLHPGDRPRSMSLAPVPGDRSRAISLAPAPDERSALPVRPNVRHLHPVAPASRPMPTVRSLPTAQPVPGWLRALAIAQRLLVPVTVAMVGATAVVYGWSVYTQQRWSQNYRQLEALRQQEQQLLAADEVFKNQLAQQAMGDNHALVTSDLNSTLFMDAPPPVAPRPAVPPEPVAPSQLSPARPLAY